MKRLITNLPCTAGNHDWTLSPSGQFRICTRDYCPAAEQLTADTWTDARPSPQALKAHATTAAMIIAKGRQHA